MSIHINRPGCPVALKETIESSETLFMCYFTIKAETMRILQTIFSCISDILLVPAQFGFYTLEIMVSWWDVVTENELLFHANGNHRKAVDDQNGIQPRSDYALPLQTPQENSLQGHSQTTANSMSVHALKTIHHYRTLVLLHTVSVTGMELNG